MDEKKHSSSELNVWPPPIHNISTEVDKPISKSDMRAMKNRWYYVFMVFMFFYLCRLDFLRHKGILLTTDGASRWFGLIFFMLTAINAWRIYIRSKFKNLQ